MGSRLSTFQQLMCVSLAEQKHFFWGLTMYLLNQTLRNSGAGWVEEHKAQFPGNEVLQKQIDDWTEEHEAEEEAKKQSAQVAVEDGWTLVTRKRVSSVARPKYFGSHVLISLHPKLPTLHR